MSLLKNAVVLEHLVLGRAQRSTRVPSPKGLTQELPQDTFKLNFSFFGVLKIPNYACIKQTGLLHKLIPLRSTARQAKKTHWGISIYGCDSYEANISSVKGKQICPPYNTERSDWELTANITSATKKSDITGFSLHWFTFSPCTMFVPSLVQYTHELFWKRTEVKKKIHLFSYVLSSQNRNIPTFQLLAFSEAGSFTVPVSSCLKHSDDL